MLALPSSGGRRCNSCPGAAGAHAVKAEALGFSKPPSKLWWGHVAMFWRTRSPPEDSVRAPVLCECMLTFVCARTCVCDVGGVAWHLLQEVPLAFVLCPAFAAESAHGVCVVLGLLLRKACR